MPNIYEGRDRRDKMRLPFLREMFVNIEASRWNLSQMSESNERTVAAIYLSLKRLPSAILVE